MLKKFKKIVLWLVFLTLYLNIGWGLGYYYHYNITTKTFESASWHAKLAGGHCAFFAENETLAEKTKEKHSPLAYEIFFSVFWPLYLSVSLISWVAHIVFWILKFIFSWAVHFIFWVLKFVGWGGLFKLVFGIP